MAARLARKTCNQVISCNVTEEDPVTLAGTEKLLVKEMLASSTVSEDAEQDPSTILKCTKWGALRKCYHSLRFQIKNLGTHLVLLAT